MSNKKRGTSSGQNWQTTIDGWIRDPSIRRYSLIALVIILLGFALIVGVASGVIGAALQTVLASGTAKAFVGGALGTGAAGWFVKRRAKRTPTAPGKANKQ